MADLVLTAARRAELTALLRDERRLEAEYPKVADYLDMVPRLSGTGDARTDGAFDVRFAHYMTGGVAESGNPYWEIVEPFVSIREGRRVLDGGRPEGSARLAYAQMILQAAYAYAIPSPDTVDWISGFSDGRPLVELGAGRGYWAAQLSRSGIVLDAYDSDPPDVTENISFPEVEGQVDVWHPVRHVEELATRAGAAADYVLFLCWPPGWGDTMASRALASFEEAGGERLVYIGEPKGGRTGDDAFFEALSARWRLESEDPRYVAWWTSNDAAQGWVRS